MVWLLGVSSRIVKTALVVPESPSVTMTSPWKKTEGTMTLAVDTAILFEGFQSGWLAAILTVFVMTPVKPGTIAICTVAVAALAKVPRLQTTAEPIIVQLPCEDVAETKLAPGGNGFVTTTPVAVAGPRFVTVILLVRELPMTTVFGEAWAAMARLAEPL